jgi:YD repeat-containing protein
MPSRRARDLTAVLAVTAGSLLLASAATAQSWEDYVSIEDGFATAFPGKPDVRTIEWDSEYGAVFPGRVHSLESDGHYYAVTVIDYRDSQAIHRARTNYTEADDPLTSSYWRIDWIASTAYAATRLRQRGGTITFDAWHHIDEIPGHQLQITNPDGSRTYAGVYQHDHRLYIIEATVPRSAPPQGIFQQGLRFIDEQGRRIRYEYNENGERVREIRETVVATE